MSETETKNAVIKSTHLGFEDHGILTFCIDLDYGPSVQSFGGYGLGSTKSTLRTECGFGMTVIAVILDTVGVDSWEKLVGKPVRVKASHEGIEMLGNFLKEKWVDIKMLARTFETDHCLTREF